MTESRKEIESLPFHAGKPNTAYSQYFDGMSWLAPLSREQVTIFNVTFEPGCRNHWHGAAKDSWFQHFAAEVAGEETSNEWCEAVSPEEYALLK